MRTKKHNAGLKKWRLVNERKLAKSARDPVDGTRGKRNPRATLVVAGDVFDKLTAVEDAGADRGGNQRWLFACVCGARVTCRVSTVRSNLRTVGWCSCPACYHAAGGWEAIARIRQPGATGSPAGDDLGTQEIEP